MVDEDVREREREKEEKREWRQSIVLARRKGHPCRLRESGEWHGESQIGQRSWLAFALGCVVEGQGEALFSRRLLAAAFDWLLAVKLS